MLIIHSGLPKTGTTTLQQRLDACADDLAQTGLIYPEGFRTSDRVAHHEIAHEITRLNSADGPAVAGFVDFLKAHRDKSVLISSEAFTNCVSGNVFGALKDALAQFRRIMPVTWVCSLRRADQLMQSMYLHQVKVGEIKTDIEDYLGKRWFWYRQYLRLTAELRSLDIVDHVHFVRYQRGETFVTDLWRAFGLTPEQINIIGAMDQRNVALTLKSYAVALCVEDIAPFLAPQISADFALRQVARGGLTFGNDIGKFSVIPFENRVLFHEAALRASLEFGHGEYFSFFHKDNIEPVETQKITADLLTRADLEELKSQLLTRQAAGSE